MKIRSLVFPESECEARHLSDWLVPRAAAFAVTTATGGTLLARASLIHRQGAAFPIFAVQGLDGGLRAFLCVHGNESEAAGASGFLIHHDMDLVYRAVLGKHVPEVVFGDLKGKISNE